MDRRRLARLVPGVSGLLATLDATRAERDRLRVQLEDARTERLGEPSFFAQYERLRRVRAHAEEVAGRRHPIWGSNSKLAGRELARRVGVQVPELLGGPAPPGELLPPSGGGFVLKPVEGSTSRGVFAVIPEGGAYRSVLDGSRLTWEELQGAAEAAVAEGSISEEFLLEELVAGSGPRTLPYDYKCYCFGGRVELVMQKDARDTRRSSRARFKFWDRTFADLGPVRHAERLDPTLPPPPHPTELIAAAEAIASVLPSTFVRVDLYDPPTGVVFGEITPHPGGLQRFEVGVDRLLGEAWERAEAATLVTEILGPDAAPRPSGRGPGSGGDPSR
jgi:hypothetical protein